MTSEACHMLVNDADEDSNGSLNLVEFQLLIQPFVEDNLCEKASRAVAVAFNNTLVCGTSADHKSPCTTATTEIPIHTHSNTVSYHQMHDGDNISTQVWELCSYARHIISRLPSCSDEKPSSSQAHESYVEESRNLQSVSQCQDLARRADEDSSGGLDRSEYNTFVEYMRNCPGTVSSSEVWGPAIWQSAQCLCDDLSSFCCDNVVQLQSVGGAYWNEICASIRNAGLFFGSGSGCVFPTPQPTLAPVGAPTQPPVEPVQYPAVFLDCVNALKDADGDGNRQLVLSEFAWLLSCGGNTIVNPSVFSSLADGTSISIGEAYLATGWTDGQQDRLLDICNADACEAAPVLNLCESQLLAADENGDGELNQDEYFFFLDLVTECRNPPFIVAFPLYETARCLCSEFTNDLFCCLFGATVDISMLDAGAGSLGSNDQAYIDRLCQVSSGINFVVVGEPVCPPTGTPTRQPTQRPTRNPTIAPRGAEVQVTPNPTPNPTALQAVDVEPGCIPALLQADANEDRELDSGEYGVFVAILAGCSANAPSNTVDLGFRSTICASCFLVSSPTCCLTNSGIELTPLYGNPTSFSSLSYATLICASNAIAIGIFNEEIGCATPQPTPLPTPPPTPLPTPPPTVEPATNTPVSLAPTRNPTAPPVSSSPTREPTPAPTPAPVQRPTPRPVVPPTPAPVRPPSPSPTRSPITDRPTKRPTFPPTTKEPTPKPAFSPVAVSQTQIRPAVDPIGNCVQAMVAADDGDNLLRPNEYLQFLVRFSGCPLITELSDEQRSTFLELACVCLDDVRFTPECCLWQNAIVNIEGSEKGPEARSSRESSALRNICNRSTSILPRVCAPPPTPRPTRSPPVPAPTAQPVTAPSQVITSPVTRPESSRSPTMQPLIDPTSLSPTRTPVIRESEFCRSSLDNADANEDRFLDAQEFLVFIRLFSVCQFIEELTFRQLGVFLEQACECDDDSLNASCCAVNPKVSISDGGWKNAVPAGFENNRAQLCSAITPVLESTCLPPAPELLLADSELRTCTNSLAKIDDGDDSVSREEFVDFLQLYGKCDSISPWDYSVAATLYSYSCKDEGDSVGDCARNPSVNVSGVSLAVAKRSPEQIAQLNEICVSSSDLIDRDCKSQPSPPTNPGGGDCAAALSTADQNSDGNLDYDEFFAFIKVGNPECNKLGKPTAAQNLAFGMLSCMCIYTKRDPFCCISKEVARIDYVAAELPLAKRYIHLTMICRASIMTAFSCKKENLDPFPSGTYGPESRSATTHFAAVALLLPLVYFL